MNRYCSLLLVVTVVGLASLGLIMMFSADAMQTGTKPGFNRQLVWLGLGGGLCYVLALIDYRSLIRYVWVLFGVTAVLLVLCLMPQLGGVELNGAHRWVNLGVFGLPGVQFQPSELAKLAGIFVLAAWYHRRGEEVGNAFQGFFAPAAIVAILIGLIAVEVDMGASALLAATSGTIMLMAGVRYRWLILAGSLGVALLGLGVWLVPERMDRLFAFLDLEKHAKGEGMQQVVSLQALGFGGWSGSGLGYLFENVQRLPYADSDFVFPVIGGELGLRASLLVVFGYVILLVSGITIALNAPDRFGMLLGVGVICLISFQAIINIGVATAVLPNKGLPLPFVSRGGTNLLACLAGIGLLLSIHRQAWDHEEYVTPLLRQKRITPRL